MKSGVREESYRNCQSFWFQQFQEPVRGLHFQLSYTKAQKGDDFSYAEYANIPGFNLHTLPVLENIIWEKESLAFNANYEIVAGFLAYLRYEYSSITGEQQTYTPEFYWGKTNTITIGARFGI